MIFARPLLVFLLGGFALLAQTLLFRDFLGAFEGSELAVGAFFGAWLLWVGAGAIAGRRLAEYARHFPAASLLYLPGFLAEHTLIRASRDIAGLAAYDVFPYGVMAALSLLTLAPLSFLTGLLFTLACSWWEEANSAEPVSRVYVYETLGAALGGLAITLALAARVPGATALLAAALLLSIASAMAGRGPVWRWLLPGLLGAVLCFGGGARWAERDAQDLWGRLLPREDYLGRFATAQNEYLYGVREGQFIVANGSGVCESVPEAERGGEVAAITLSQHPEAKRILVLGPDSLPVCQAFAAIPQVAEVVWLHPDPEYPKRLREILPERFQTVLQGITAPESEARAYLASASEPFDLIVLNLPDATTLVLNRYYTRAFLDVAKAHLGGQGVLAMRATGASNYLGGELAYLGASAKATLEEVFEQVVMKPGEDTWLMASENAALSESPAVLRDRFAAIPGSAAVYPPENLLALYPSDRIAFQKSRYYNAVRRAGREMLVNTETHPKALLFATLLALRQAGIRGLAASLPVFLRALLIGAFAAAFGYPLLRALYRRRQGVPGAQNIFDAGFLIFSTGLAGMSTSVLLMFLYQTRFGSLFLYIGLISALFMAGAFAGGIAIIRLLERRGAEPRFLLPLCLAAHAGLLAAVFFLPDEAPALYYAILITLAGGFNGLYFPLAAHRLRQAGRTAAHSAALLETLDHLGAAAGALLAGLFLLPLLGAQIAATLLGLLLLGNLPAALSPRRSSRMQDPFDRIFRPLAYGLFGVAGVCLIASYGGARVVQAQSAERVTQAVRQLAGESPIEKHEARLENGTPFTYFSAAPGPYYFDTLPLAPGINGYAGPLDLAIALDAGGALKEVRIAASRETPAYLELVTPWLAKLAGRNLFSEQPFADVDAVSGATITSKAVQRTLATAARHFAAEILKQPLSGASSPAPTDARPFWLAGFLLGALLLRFRPGKLRRRLFLAASALVLGFYLNLQYSSQQVFALLSGEWPSLGWNAGYLLLLGVPVLTLLVGNLYCGYVCPFGALQELAGDLRPAMLRTDIDKNTWRFARAIKYLLLFVLALGFAVSRDFATLSTDPLLTVFSVIRSRATLFFALLLLALAFPFRRFWCRNLCPAGAFLSLLNRLRLVRAWSPPVFPRRCDMGVRHADELDCLRCDRCAAKDAPEQPALSQPRLNRIFLALALILAGAFALLSIQQLGATLAEGAAITSTAPAGAGKPREVNLPKLQQLLHEKRLSDHEADFYRPVLPAAE